MIHSISLPEACEMTRRYREHREAILKTEYQDQAILPLSETFEKSAITAIAGQSGCSFIRIYYGMDEDYKVHAIIVGANADDEDMLPPETLNAEDEDSLAERALRCPDICPPKSVLNGDDV